MRGKELKNVLKLLWKWIFVNQTVILQAEAAVYITMDIMNNLNIDIPQMVPTQKKKTTKGLMQTACISTLQNQSKKHIFRSTDQMVHICNNMNLQLQAINVKRGDFSLDIAL